MKKKIIILSFWLLGLILPFSIVNAEEVIIKNVQVESDLLDLEAKVSDQLRAGSSTYITLSDGNTAYCIDPGEPVPGNNGKDLSGFKCTKTEYKATSQQQQSELSYILGSSSSSATKGLALRFNLASTGTITNSDQNATCAYIYAGYQGLTGKEKEDYAKKYDGYKSTGGTKCLQYKTKGDNTKKYEGDNGLSAGDAAYQLAASAKSNKGGTIKPTYKVDESKGQITITITVPKEITDAKIKILCTNCSGDTGEKVLKTGDNKFVLKSSSTKNESNCGTYSAILSYTGNANQCSKIVQYDCSYGNQSGYQNFIACDSLADGSGLATEEIKGNIPCDGKNECPDPILDDSNYGGDALCNSFGDTVIAIYEEYDAELVDECVIGGTDYMGDSYEASDFFGVDSEFCEVYCTENYEFETNGLYLSNLDYDKMTGEWKIASGSAFNFETGKTVSDVTEISCYAKIDIDKFLRKVEGAAEEYAKKVAPLVTECSANTDEEGNIVSYNKTIVKYPDNAEINKSTYKVSFIPSILNRTIVEPRKEVSSCIPTTTPVSESEKTSAINNYKKTVKDLTEKFNACTSWKLDETKLSTCDNPIVEFDYTDGGSFGIDSTKLEAKTTIGKSPTYILTSANGDYDGSNSATDKNIDLGDGLGKSEKTFKNATYKYGYNTISNVYTLDSLGYCNNYNTGEVEVNISEADCKKEAGNTYVEGWPISYNASYSSHFYWFNVSNYGHEFNNSCGGGRLTAIAEKLNKNIKDKDAIKCPFGINGCTDCPWYCDEDLSDCNFDDENCDNECIWACQTIGCLFDKNSGLAINYSPVSLINLFNLNTAYLGNQYKGAIALAWDISEESEKKVETEGIIATEYSETGLAENWASDKGAAAIEAISGLGETIYNDGDSGKLEYSITLTPQLINQIRKYNDAQEENGGYLNESLSCINVENSDYTGDGHSDYVICYSDFLKGNLSDEFTNLGDTLKENIKITENAAHQAYDDSKTTEKIARKSKTGPAWK